MKLGKIHESPVSKKASGKRSSLTLRSSKRNSINNCQIGEPQFDDNRVLVGANGVSMSATLPSEVAMNPKICESSSNTLQDDRVSLSQDRREQDSEENFTGGEEEELKEEDHKGHDSNEDEHVDKDDKDEDEKGQKEVEEEVGEGDEADKNGEKDEEDDDDDMTLDRLVAKPLYRKVSARAVSDKIKEDAGVKTIADDVDDCFTLQSLKVVAKEETHHFISKTGFKVSPVASDGVHVLLSSGGVSKGRRAARKPKSVVKFELLSSQTVDRKMRKRKQNDMASDGDLEWDALMGDADGTRDANGVDRPGRGKSKLESGSSLAGYSISGEVAAVAAGLRARAPGPTEKVRFKDVLKRRGGLQEYIECRNMVLSLWEKDVQHILSVNDCGVSPVRKEGESPRATLIRDIFEFLNYHGYINIGVAKKKLKPCSSEEQVTEEVLNAPRLVLTSFPTLKGFDDITLQDENINDYLEAKEEAEEEAATGEAENSNYIREVVETGLECSHTLEDNPLAVVKDHSLYTTAGNARKRTLEESEALLPSKKQFVVKETFPDILDSSGNFESATKPLSMEDVNFSSFDENHSLEDKAQSEVVGSAIFDVREDRLHCDSEALRNVESLKSAMLRKQEIEKIKAEAHIESEDILELSNQPEIKHSLAFERHSMSDKVDRTEVPQTLRKCETRDNITANERMREVGNGSIFPEPDQKSSGRQKHIIVVGAGPAGLAASRQMQRMNLKVTVLEARDRVGGRVYTDRCTFSVPVDLGASIITGVEADVTTERRADPSSLLCKQLGLQLTTLRGDCPLYDSVTGLKVPADVDEELEAEYNSLLDDTVVLVAQNGDKAMRMSLEEGLEKALKKRRTVQHSKQEVKDNRMDGVISPLPCQKTTQVGIKESFQDIGDSSIREENDGAVSCQYVHRQIEFSSSGALRDFCHDSFSETLKFDEEKASNQVVGTISEPNIDPSNVEPPSEISQGLQLGSLNLSELERRIMDWHFANLEYGCAAQLCQVSLPYWNQDDAYGGFGGPHCMIKEGYGTLMEALAEGLDIRLGQVVTEIKYMVPESQNRKDCDGKVKVQTMSGDEFVGDAVLVTVPLGCLKADTIKFLPSLPLWKSESIRRLGFGTLNKVVLEFPVAFWDDSVDYFGATAKNTESRGRCFMFWNLKRTACAPILVALVVGKAALEEEKKEKSQLIRHALNVLRKLFGEEAVPEPKASAVTNWGCEQYSRGAYSYVALGASGEDYDILGRPVENCIFFAGEATCKEHPDTVGGAFMSGLREAIRIVGILENHEDVTLEAENSRGTQRQSESERNEVRDMAKRLAAADLSTVLLGEGATLDAEQKPFTRADLLKDMFSSANTAAGRLLVAKEMLQEPISVVKAFAGTKAGLTVLNTWILDSMGKDATQLLRHCVRLLLVVATDLRSIRQSGIGKTVKEKVCVHTSRDIRAIAGQLVKMWIEVFRREKSTLGALKPSKKASSLVHTNSDNMAKVKSKKIKEVCNVKSSTPGVAKASLTMPSMPTGGPQDSRKKLDSGIWPFMLDEQQKSEPSLDGVVVLVEERVETSAAEETVSEVEASTLAAAKAAQAAAKAYASVEAQLTSLPILPEIVSFHKFAKREKLAVKEATADLKRRKWPDLENPGISSLSMEKSLEAVQVGLKKVSNWSLELTGSCGNLNSPDYGGHPSSPGGHEIPFSSIESDTAYILEGSSAEDKKIQSVSVGTNTMNSIEQPVNSEVQHGVKLIHTVHATAGSESPMRECLQLKSETQSVAATEDFPDSETFPHGNEGPLFSEISKKTSNGGEASYKVERESEKPMSTVENVLCLQKIKKAVSDYVVHLLTPLYKTRKLQKDGFKAIVKKTVAKVMERDAPKDATYDISEFLSSKRKNKIRALVDRYVEIHMSHPT